MDYGEAETFLLKGPHLTDRLAHPERSSAGAGAQGYTRDMLGGSELLGFRERTGGAACSQTEG